MARAFSNCGIASAGRASAPAAGTNVFRCRVCGIA